MTERACLFFLSLFSAAASFLFPTSANAQAAVSSHAANLVVAIQGHAEVKRKNWSNFAPLAFGAEIETGDVLRLDPSSSAKVVCSDLTLRDLNSGTTGTPCVPSQDILRRSDGSLIRPTRSASGENSYPVILSPRRTKLLSDNPLLRWTAVKDASVYQVIVRGPDLFWMTIVRSKTEVSYPDSAPKLEPGKDYKLIVRTSDDQTSENEQTNGLGFSLLPSRKQKVILDQQEQIEHLGLQDGTTQYLLAHLDASYGVNAEAIQCLENASSGFQISATERLLGQLYLAIRLPRQAEAHYLKSLELSQKDEDQEGQLQARLALAGIYADVVSNRKAAAEQLEGVIAIAGNIGDDLTIKEARKKLSIVK
jgi:hypothetical protein